MEHKAREKEKLLSDDGLRGSSETTHGHEASPSLQTLNSISKHATVSKLSENQAMLTCYNESRYAAFGPFAFIMKLLDAVSLNNHGVHVGLDCCSSPLRSQQHTLPCPRCGRQCPVCHPSSLSVRCCHCNLTAARDDPNCPFSVIVEGSGFRIHGDTIKYKGGAIKVVGHCNLRIDRRNNIYVKGGSEIAILRRCNDIHVVGGGEVSAHRCNNVHVDGGGSVSVRRCNDVRVEGAGDVFVHRCADAQIHASGHVRIRRCDDARIERSGDARIQRCNSARIIKSCSARIQRCGSAMVEGSGDVHIHRCGSARVEGCGAVRIRRCDTARVGNCHGVQIHRGQILPLDQWFADPGHI